MNIISPRGWQLVVMVIQWATIFCYLVAMVSVNFVTRSTWNYSFYCFLLNAFIIYNDLFIHVKFIHGSFLLFFNSMNFFIFFYIFIVTFLTSSIVVF